MPTDEELIAEYLERVGVTRCPTACVAPTRATLKPEDREALVNRSTARESGVRGVALLSKKRKSGKSTRKARKYVRAEHRLVGGEVPDSPVSDSGDVRVDSVPESSSSSSGNGDGRPALRRKYGNGSKHQADGRPDHSPDSSQDRGHESDRGKSNAKEIRQGSERAERGVGK